MENELIEQFKNDATNYGKAVGNAGKLHLIGVVSRILGLFLLIFSIVLCALAFFAFAAVAAIDALAQCMPVWAAALVIGTVYLLLIMLALVCRKQLFINPFIKLMSEQLIDSEEKLEIETLKAEHEMELQSVRIEARVENATRELSFYTNLAARLWNTLKSLISK